MRLRTLIIATQVVAASASLWADDKSIPAVFTANVPSLDGTLNQGWSAAAVVSGFRQREPFGRPGVY